MGRPRPTTAIERADLDGGNLTTVVPAGGTFTPKQLKLDPVHRKLYWSDREGMRVMRANLDGSNIETLVETARGEAARRGRGQLVRRHRARRRRRQGLLDAEGRRQRRRRQHSPRGPRDPRRRERRTPLGHRGAVRQAARADRPRSRSGSANDLLDRSR